MNINQNIIGSYDTHLQERDIRLENAKGMEQTARSESSGELASLKEGAVFKGEILEIVGDKVTIALENEAMLKAKLQNGVELGVGDSLFFSVKENNSSLIMIKPLFGSLYSAQEQTLEKALDAAGLSPTEKNFSAAKVLMEAGMPLDKGSIVKVLSQSMKFEGTSLQTLVSLNKMNIPVTEANIAQYERYQKGSHQLAGDIHQTAESMAEFPKMFPEGTSQNTLVSVAKQMLDIFSPEPESTILQGTNETVAENGMVSEMEGMAEGETALASDALEGKFGLTKENVANLESQFQKAGISGEQIKSMLQDANSPKQMLQQITETLSQIKDNPAVVQNILNSAEYQKLFSDMVKGHWALDPKTMKEPKEIEELYNKILRQSKAAEEAVTANGGSAKEFSQNSQNMSQNMRFMEQLNTQMFYAQMPLKLSNQNTNSELYVYADKRKLMQKTDGISVMLHLDMDHLGATDVKVTLTGKNVHARFYLNDQESVDLVAENMEQLGKQLADRGFSLTNEVVKREPEKSINQVVDEIIDENAERSIKRYTFDMRT